jgi:hypothetical protein
MMLPVAVVARAAAAAVVVGQLLVKWPLELMLLLVKMVLQIRLLFCCQ